MSDSSTRSDNIRADIMRVVRADDTVPYGTFAGLARKYGVSRVWVQRLASQQNIFGSRRKDTA